jgi:hypothetical protein
MICLRWRPAALWLITLLLLPLGHGCDDGKPAVDTSKNEATVSGIVMVRGKPAAGGTILFNASNSERIVPHKTAPIGADGTYTITTYTGGNQVSFDGDVANKNRGVGLIKEFVEVKRGENKADFNLLGEGGQNLPFPVPEKARSKGRPAS